jgi:hypothetical protein
MAMSETIADSFISVANAKVTTWREIGNSIFRQVAVAKG